MRTVDGLPVVKGLIVPIEATLLLTQKAKFVACVRFCYALDPAAIGRQAALQAQGDQHPEASQQHPDLAGALDQIRVSSSGDRLKVDAPVSQDTLMSLIHSRALAVTM